MNRSSSSRNMLLVSAVLLVAVGTASGVQRLQEMFNWRQLDFQFPSIQMKQQALASGAYIPTNALPVGIEHWGNKLFVSVPRWRDGTYSVISSRYYSSA